MNGLNEKLQQLKLKGEQEKSPKRVGPPIPPKPKHPNPNSIVAEGGGNRQGVQPIYDNVSQINTLDNSLVLEQQLAALEHHKQSLEAQKYRTVTPSPGPEKPSAVAARTADGGLVYSNIVHTRSGSGREEKNVYSNIPYNRSTSDDFPPPPPIELNPDPNHEYTRHVSSEDELPPPPSPVSSSYSELRRAIDSGYPTMATYAGIHPAHVEQNHSNFAGIYQNEYGAYAPISQNSSTYESIYEPINPRPASEMSSRSNYSLYTPYGSREAGGAHHGGYKGVPKEAEVDVLTEMLVQSLDGHADADSYGICVKCGDRVIGENSGCTAMNQIYHIECFTCCQCQINLQGKPFYAVEDKPYCEDDYLNTLEKCSVCVKPILERILRATGKPYHPGCFCCIVCGKSLDGIPFTVDATNQIHCIEDFHKKFAPRCCVCKLPIMPEPGKEETVRVVALDRSFHPSCYKCEDCGLLLSSEAEGRGCYPLDDHVLCKSCNAKRVQALTSHMSTEL
ncbi:lipoma-preferred partner homolog isoform X2 [Lutzomyia longipalpis]|uniref:LIM zinc-binding domain-containing protein n=1 Tax=Lutzomyia longipalpis TaxID=7200 RepID=A0A1B0CX89_LUTLO|nr:lipoma-preferred partner homolog isoform X2 [Lutzomyia longipalpis]